MKNQNIEFRYIIKNKQTISSFLLKKGYSSPNIYELIKDNNVFVNNQIIIDRNHQLYKNDEVLVVLTESPSSFKTVDKPIDIVYEDNYLLVVNKPFDLNIEPSKTNYEDSLAQRVAYYFKNNEINSKVHLVNRLDRLTSGLVVIAKNKYIHNLFQKVKIKKSYLALVEGKTNKFGKIVINIEKENNSVKRIVSEDGKRSITKYQRLSYDGKNSLLKVKLLTGRTHQIRLSFASINHPLVGDSLYNDNKKDGKMHLQAYYLKFKHPITHKYLKLSI